MRRYCTPYMSFIAESCLWRMRLHGSAQLAFSSAARRTAQLTWLLMLTAHDCRAANQHRAADCTAGRLHSTANCSWFSGREAGCRMPRGRLRGSSRSWKERWKEPRSWLRSWVYSRYGRELSKKTNRNTHFARPRACRENTSKKKTRCG